MKLTRKKIIGLKISRTKLNQIRSKRLISMGLNGAGMYSSDDRITEELKFFKILTDKLGCFVLDVTNKAIEETANDILMHIGEIADENLELLRRIFLIFMANIYIIRDLHA